ncbi:DUF6223 family protein [Micromonospora sp. LOL_025]|uniref:DUF6223 family protein n=1 Tax=Micromonospora sp. LOL_025 TaxID=3345413 RepID=UPI003A83C6DC
MRSSGALSSVRRVLAVVGAALLGVFAPAVPAAADGSAQPVAAGVTAMSSGRLGATVAVVLGLSGVVVGGLALARPAGRFGTGSGRLGVIVAVAAGVVGMALGGLVMATSDGAVGTGNGLGGAIVALVVGLIAVTLGGLALARSRRLRAGDADAARSAAPADRPR